MFKLPSNILYNQPNSADTSGNLWSTKNITFDRDGYATLSDATFATFDGGGDTDWDEVVSIRRGRISGNDQIWILSDDTFETNEINLLSSVNNATTDESAPTPGSGEDIEIFNGDWVITDGSSIKYRDGGSWTSILGTPASAIGENVLGKFPYQNGLLVANRNEVALVNTSWSVVTTLVLPEEYEVTSMTSVGTYAYIGTKNITGDNAALFRWNGSTAANNGLFEVNDTNISSTVAYKNSVACVTGNGQLLYFTGSAMQTLANFPAYELEHTYTDADDVYPNVGVRGMVTDRDKIYICVHNQIDASREYLYPETRNGVWCYDPRVGLYHRHSASRNKFINAVAGTGDVNTTTNVITTNVVSQSGVTPPTGTAVYFSTTTGAIGGLENNRWYYIINVSNGTFKLAQTKELAEAGTEINLTSFNGNNCSFYLLQRKDYGHSYLADPSSIALLQPTEYAEEVVGRVLFGANVENESLVDVAYLYTTQPETDNVGHFITPKLRATADKDAFTSLTLRFNQLQTGDSIKIKYRTEDRFNKTKSKTLITNNDIVTWTSTTVCTSNTDLRDVKAGDEIEIIGGAGAGQSFEIASITESGGTYTITLSEANTLVSANDKSRFFISNWKELETINSDYADTVKNVTIAKKSSWIQFKLELKGVRVTLQDLIINNVGSQIGK